MKWAVWIIVSVLWCLLVFALGCHAPTEPSNPVDGLMSVGSAATGLKNLLAGGNDQMSMWPLWGDPGHLDPYMTHRWGYTPKTLKQLLTSVNFVKAVSSATRTHGAKVTRDMRMEARKA